MRGAAKNGEVCRDDHRWCRIISHIPSHIALDTRFSYITYLYISIDSFEKVFHTKFTTQKDQL